MDKKATKTIRKQLKETLTDRKFSRLEGYEDPKSWKGMSPADRELLGTLFILQGEQLLNANNGNVDGEALRPFDLAVKAAPKNPEVFYKKGLAYTMEGSNGRHLAAGCRAFAKAIELNPDYFDAWYAWGRSLFLIGDRRDDDKFFLEATEKFRSALQCNVHSEREMGRFYWLWGHCWRRLADNAGEAVDYQEASDKFRLAAEAGYNEIDLWNDYGHVLSHLTALLGREEFFHQVVNVYKRAVIIAPDNFEAWFNLACSSTCLYEFHSSEESFRSAYSAFEQATRCRPGESNSWFYWAQLLLTSGKIERDIGKLKESLALFERAEESGQLKRPLLYCRWGEALMNCGSYLEDYQMLNEAKEKIAVSLDLAPEVTEVWYFYGRCLAEIGRYFNDVDYYFEAIDKYSAGQAIEENFPPFFYGLALAYSEAAELSMDVELLNQSLKNFEKLKVSAHHLPSQFWLDWAGVLARYGEATQQKHSLEEALDCLEKAILMEGESEPDKNPHLLDILYNYGCTLDSYGDFCDEPLHYERAVKVLIKVIEVDPKHMNARYNLAIALTHLGELVNDLDCFQAANDQFEMILQADSEDAISWNDWGICLLHWAQLVIDPVNEQYASSLFAHAEAKLSQAAALGNVYAYYNIACYHALQGRVAMAIHFLEKSEKAGALPRLQEIMQDEWLGSMREQEEFRHFLSKLVFDNPTH